MTLENIAKYKERRRNQIRLVEHIERMHSRLWALSDQELKVKNSRATFGRKTSVETIEKWSPSLRSDPAFQIIRDLYWEVDSWAKKIGDSDLYKQGLVKENLGILGLAIASRNMREETYKDILEGTNNYIFEAKIALADAQKIHREILTKSFSTKDSRTETFVSQYSA